MSYSMPLCRRHLVQLLVLAQPTRHVHLVCRAAAATPPIRRLHDHVAAHRPVTVTCPVSLNGRRHLSTSAPRLAKSKSKPQSVPRLTYAPAPSSLTPWTQATSTPVAQAITAAHGFTHCTPVQSAVHKYLVPGGPDAMIRAPTGSGKTLAFLAPALAHLTQSPRASNGPRVLVLSPTRELAQQTRREAEALVKSGAGALGKIVVAGAIPESRQRASAAARDKPTDWSATDMVVATPGKLLDVLSQHPRLFSDLDMLILDEADRMLDSNFLDQVSTILTHLPTNRQTLLLSATYSPAIRTLAATSLRPGFHAISTIPTTDATPLDSIRQFYAVAPMSGQPALLHALIHRCVLASATTNAPPLKAMVFLPTVALTTLYASLFTKLFTQDFVTATSPTASKRLPSSALPPILAIHSNLSPASRTRVASAFAAAPSGILFTSDISARGMDYADVRVVVQLGLPASLDTYVHRVGRTGRAGRTDGIGLAVLAPFERAVALEQVAGVGVVEADLVNGCVDGIGLEAEGEGKVKWDGASSARLVRVAVAQGAVGEDEVKAAYLGMLGYYENHLPRLVQSGLSSYTVVKHLDAFASAMGLKTLPKLPQGLRAAFGDAQEMTVDKRVKVQGKAMAKAGVGAGVSKKLLKAAERQHKNNQAKVLAGAKRRRPVLDNEFAYRRE